MGNEIFDWDRIWQWSCNIYYCIQLNLLFWLFSFPFTGFLILIGASGIREFLPLFFITFLSCIPAFSAVLYCMERLIMNREMNAFKDFIKGYRVNFLQSLKIGGIQAAFLFMITINIRVIDRWAFLYPAAVIFRLLFFLILLSAPNLYLLLVKYRMDTLLVIKTGIAITIGRLSVTVGNTAAFLFMLLLYEYMSVLAVFILVSLYGYLILIMNKKLVIEMIES